MLLTTFFTASVLPPFYTTLDDIVTQGSDVNNIWQPIQSTQQVFFFIRYGLEYNSFVTRDVIRVPKESLEIVTFINYFFTHINNIFFL